MIMSYRKYLLDQIKNIELQIENSKEKVDELRAELQKLKLKEFEEAEREENNQQLLKG